MISGRTEIGRNVALAFGLVVAAAISTCLVAYSLGKRTPPIPADPDHLRSVLAPQCLSCHGPLGARPRGRNHPLNDQCFSCHERT